MNMDKKANDIDGPPMGPSSMSMNQNKIKTCCIPLCDDTLYPLPLAECLKSGKISFSLLESIVEDNLDEGVSPAPVQILISDDRSLLSQCTLPAEDVQSGGNNVSMDKDLLVVSDEDHRKRFEEDMIKLMEEESVKEHSITGIELPPFSRNSYETKCNSDDIIVDINIYRPQGFPDETEGDEHADQYTYNSNSCYKGDWKRRHYQNTLPNTTPITSNKNGGSGDCMNNRQQHAIMQLIDLTLLQTARRQYRKQEFLHHSNSNTQPKQEKSGTDSDLESKIRFDDSGSVFHVLRSVLSYPLGGLHCASPWNASYTSDVNNTCASNEEGCGSQNDVIAFLLYGQPCETNSAVCSHDAENSHFDALEQRELGEFLRFRTGDASPSYYLYSYAALLDGKKMIDTLMHYAIHDSNPFNDVGINDDTHRKRPMTILFYKRMPPRRHLSSTTPESVKRQQSPLQLSKGCLWEEFKRFVEPQPSSLLSLSSSSKVHTEKGGSSNATLSPSNYELVHRIVAPPYQSHSDIYPGILDHFLTPENLAALTKEAMSIPQWTAWPETTHYSQNSNNQIENDNEDNSQNGTKSLASWSVFPLCHTFPATDAAYRKWIHSTCNYVPHTVKLLKQIGTPLRTALFSRLEPNTTLGSHRGWADLANHVLRLHIPLIVPSTSFNQNYNENQINEENCSTSDPHSIRRRCYRPKTAQGLCGAWVDGCVETHRVGEILCFDDSKIHRAFNYNATQERIVLIVDLARPVTKGEEGVFPTGTSTGAHTNELDEFIEQFS